MTQFEHDGEGPDVDPVTGDEAETFDPPQHFVLEVDDSYLGHHADD